MAVENVSNLRLYHFLIDPFQSTSIHDVNLDHTKSTIRLHSRMSIDISPLELRDYSYQQYKCNYYIQLNHEDNRTQLVEFLHRLNPIDRCQQRPTRDERSIFLSKTKIFSFTITFPSTSQKIN